MKNKLLSLLCSIVLALAVLAGAMPVFATEESNSVVKAQAIIDGIIDAKTDEAYGGDIQKWIDGELSERAGVGAEWYILALSQSGEYGMARYESALLSYLDSNEVYSASSRQKYALILCAVGSTDAYITKTIGDSIGKQGIMSYIYGAHLLNNGYVSEEHTADSVKDKLVSLECEGGGWSLRGDVGDVDVTAMAVQALAPFYGKDEAVSACVDRAVTLLSERQLEGGGYEAYGVANPDSSAQIVVALSAIGIDVCEDSRFIKNGEDLLDVMLRYRLPSGGFSHVLGEDTNDMATAQVLYSAVAYTRMKEGKPPLYILDRADADGVRYEADETLSDNTDTEPQSSLSDSDNAEAKEKKHLGYKPIACAAIALAAGVLCLVLFLLKKRGIKRYIAILLVAAAAVCIVCFTDLRSADDYYSGESEVKASAIGSVTVTVRCDTVAGLSDDAHIPADGVILPVTEVDIEDGDTVYSVLMEIARVHGLQVENNGSADMAYIVGINYLYEFDFGDLSGWVYRVNGEATSVGCSEYVLSDGDVIEWHYSRELGEDIK